MTLKPKAGRRSKAVNPASSAAAGGLTGSAVSVEGASTALLAAPVALRRTSKGRRPNFYENPAVDQLFAIVTALAGEVSVAFDRLDALERTLTAARVIPADGVESYQPSDAAQQARHIAREELLQRIFAVFETYGAKQRR